jgi:hypothetical protein
MNEKIKKHILDKSLNSDKIFIKYLDQTIKYIKNKNKSLSWLLPIIKLIKSNINFILLVFFIVTLYCSNYFINLFKLFILFDSIVLSLIVLQDSKNKISCRRLAKNVISLFILTINIIGSFFSILLVILIYYSFNKYVSKTIYKIIEMFINFISVTVPFVKDLYPSIYMIDHNKHFESTELVSDSKSSSDSDSDSGSESDSDSFSISDSDSKSNKKNNEHKFYKKFISELKTDK